VSEYINHPDHYNQGDIEVIDVIEDWNLGFHLGNAIKYIARAEHKGNTKQDLEKAKWYIQRYIEECVDTGPAGVFIYTGDDEYYFREIESEEEVEE